MFGTAFSQKIFLWKIYDSDGDFVTVWTDVLTDPQFSWEMNGGFSDLVLELPRPVDGFGESSDVAYNNQLKIYVFDRDTSDEGVCIYSGYISRYEPNQNVNKQTVVVTFLSYFTQMNQYMLEGTFTGGDTEIPYLSTGPDDIMKDVLDKFTAAGGKVDYDTGTVDDPGTTVSYTFNTNLVQEAVKKIIELSPDGWFFRIEADDLLYYQEKNSTPDHTFIVGRHIIRYRQEKRIENVVNRIFFRGGGDPPLYYLFENTGSISSYGQHSIKVVDERVTDDATAEIMANRTLDGASSPEVRITLEIADNNGEMGLFGYDIESIKPGDTCRILGATARGYTYWDQAYWGTDYWDYDISNSAATTLQILKVEYTPTKVKIEISNRQPDIAKRVEDIRRNLINTQTSDNPTAPTV